MLPVMRHTTRDLRRRNRAALLSLIYHQGTASRVELMQASGLSSGSVSNVVGDLVADGMIAEIGSEDSDGGRPRTLLRVRPEFANVVGVDIGETHVQVGLFDWTLQRVTSTTFAIAETSLEPESVAWMVSAGIAKVTAEAGVDPARLLGVGVGVPGAVQPTGDGTAVHAPTLRWSGVRLDEMLAASVTAPLHIDNVARTLGQAEMWRGAGRGASRSVVALLGVGIGAALATGPGSREATSSTIEWGHTVITVGGAPCRCGSRGCLEAYVGAEAVLSRYAELPGAGPIAAVGTEGRLAELAARAAGPGPAASVLDTTAEYLGIGIANLVNLLNPDRVVLAGWVAEVIGPQILPAVRAAARRHALPYLYGQLQIRLGELGTDAVALGAATLPVVELLATGGPANAR
ncbi:ROK family transcriptional regulator [Dactylosporangium sp. NPDC051485]|uniref:ROK family transcriptional regulator n=1 Tax=Dactylosporangium sp. NPDC051485 TaxID=3154846 RepID=UPI00341C5E14